MKSNHDLSKTDKAEIFNCKNQFKGFTLIELMIAMVVGLVVLAAVYSVFILQNKELNKQEQIAMMQDNAKMGMEMLTREIMMAGYGPSTFARCAGTTTATNTPCIGITAANANAISFTLDLNGDGGHTDTNENITYDLYTSGGVQVLGRKSTATANRQPVVENVSALVFSYLPAAGTTTTSNLANIRRIQISITTRTANIDLNTGNYLYYNLVSIVTPRNLQLSGF